MQNNENVELDKFIHINLYGKCWHQYNRRESGFPICGICNKSMEWTKPHYSEHISEAWEAVAKLSKFMLEQEDEDIAEKMYRAFASRIKNECIPSKSYTDYQKLGNAEIFLLYLATPKTICLAIKDALEAKGK